MRLRTVATHHVEYRDLEKEIEDVYGKKVWLVATEEWENMGYYNFTVDGNLDHHDEEELAYFKDTGCGNTVCRMLLNDLARNDLIPCGTYSIHVFW